MMKDSHLSWDEALKNSRAIREKYEEYMEDGVMEECECISEAVSNCTMYAVDAALALWASGRLFDAVAHYYDDIASACFVA